MAITEDESGPVLPVEPFIEDTQPVSPVSHEAVVEMTGGAQQGDPFIEDDVEVDTFDVTKEWAFNTPDEDLQLRIQQALANRGLYQGKQNGAWGKLTIYAIQEAVKTVAPIGWFERVPGGEPDASLCHYIMKFGEFHGTYEVTDDDYVLTEAHWKAFLDGLVTPYRG